MALLKVQRRATQTGSHLEQSKANESMAPLTETWSVLLLDLEMDKSTD